jgi:MoaA/NifB/PqqE/SkfB family radical SAM enzyme
MNAVLPTVETGHHLRRVPVVALMPHSRCNCRCIMCDIWKANRTGKSLSPETLARLEGDFRALKVEEVLLSGGEALMHPNLWALCAVLKGLPAKVTLLSTGLLLARHAAAVTQWCDEVIVSLDGPPEIHDTIRGIAGAFAGLAQGVAALRNSRDRFPVSARCVVQRLNFRHLSGIVAAAHEMGLDRISFLAADVSTTAFNRPDAWPQDRATEICLSDAESADFCAELETFIARHRADLESGFVAESPDKLRRLGQYYRALNGRGDFPPIRCSAPWVSTVIESDGTVRACFFHQALGNIHDDTLSTILNSPEAVAFRENLDVASDPVCSRCVCTFNL